MKKVKIKNFFIGEKEPLCIISGPCVIESEQHTLQCARFLKDLFSKFQINLVFKASFDKANRSSIESFRGPGIKEGLKILSKVKEELNIPIITDIHLPEHAQEAAKICDIIQIPAFLCRQTDLIVEAAKTQKPLLFKKGQFLSPLDMKNVIDKALHFDNSDLLLTDRGTFFGYNNLVSDFTSIPIMKSFGFPVGFDATHSVQKPGKEGNQSGGSREFIPYLTKAAVAVGANFLFLETHPDPKNAKSDSFNVFAFKDLPLLLKETLAIYKTVEAL